MQRKLESALSLTMSKHMMGLPDPFLLFDQTLDSGVKLMPKEYWGCPVELVSAEENFNVDSIWEHAKNFQAKVGSDYLERRR